MEELKAKIFTILQEDHATGKLETETLMHLIRVFQQANSKQELILMLELFSDECASFISLLNNEENAAHNEDAEIQAIKNQLA